MWNNDNHQGHDAPPAFPSFPSPGGFAPPPGPLPAPGYNPGYAPAYGPPSGYQGPPPPAGFAPPPGPPPAGYGFPQGPPQGGYTPPPGPPPQPATRGFPGAQWRQNNQPPPPPPSHQAGYQPSYAAPHMPPSQVQHYGPHSQTPGGRDVQPYFQYSQCTGKKKALLIGINYIGQSGELRGCINDVKNIKRFLTDQWGYKEGDIVTLTDDESNPRMRPTASNIRQAMKWLVAGAQPNDALFFHFSGHGGQTKDRDGDEADGYDEVIYPVGRFRSYCSSWTNRIPKGRLRIQWTYRRR
ncbi:hypothetical protein CC2G_007286 [Coprinopsis cinerea AmutBmut pab1-1]|nr:hypothetical protein CC2G_007286 [Coprinopsis cinerea AmutBmut pab1-1]